MTHALRSKSMKSLSTIAPGSTQSSVGSVNSNLFKKYSAANEDSRSAFVKTKSDRGMLDQMNSTAINGKSKEKERGGWRQHETTSSNHGAESTLDITDFHTDFSSTGYDYETSTREDPARSRSKQKHLPRPDLAPPKAGNSKRMRSPNSLVTEPHVNVHVPLQELERIKISSPEKSLRMENNENRSPRDTARSKQSSELARQLMGRSPMDGSKYSLPNYGLKNSNRCALSPTAVAVGRSSSQCSTNSEFTQNDGKFPLKSSKTSLSWDCVKLRKSIAKSFVVKNASHKRITLNVEVIGPGFQVISPSQENGSLVLQSNECCTINVTFCPTVIGKAVGEVVFKPLKGWPEDIQRRVRLCGYGGNTSLQLRGIERGPVGTPFLKLGETSTIQTTTLQRSFTVYNKGPLRGMATISVKPKTSQYIHDAHIAIEPNKCIIEPDSSVHISVTYKLRRKDVEKLSKKTCDVLTVAVLEVILGAESNRQRIATILTQTGAVPPAYAPLNFLVSGFPNVKESFGEFCETVEEVGDLFSSFKTSEIALTINRTALDETRDTCTELSGIEDSVFFRSMMGDTPDGIRRRGATADSHFKPISEEQWSVYPKQLIMDEMNNNRKSIIIQNNFSKAQTFQIDCNSPNLFSFSKNADQIPSGGTYNIDVSLKPNAHIPSDIRITIYIETDCMDIPVIVKPLPPYSRQFN